jgi:serine racemase
VGAFKFRGAYNTLAMINESLKGQQQHVNNDDNDNANVNVNVFVVTHSSGNHAQALALAARLFHFTAHIIMPSTSSQIKKDAVKQYGAVIHECQPNQQARESLANEVMNRLIETYGHQYVHFVHPYDQASIIAGQGTAAVEFIQQVKQLVTDNNNHNSNTSTTDDDDGMLDAIICPVGGGGLLSGTCISVKHLSPLTKIYAAEPLNANDCARSFQSKEYTTNDSPPKSIADGLLTNTGRSTYPIIMDHITDVITVTEDEIITAMKLIWTRMKLVIEPSTGK